MPVDVAEAIRVAEALLPGVPIDERQDPRWQAIIEVSEYIWSGPEEAVEAVWQFIRRWGVHPQEDLRDAVATCLLEHLLQHHFAAYFPQVEELALADPLFGYTFERCWQFGQALEPGNAERFVGLREQLAAAREAKSRNGLGSQ
jgi:hypothetical protein